jgi:hydroxymethylpyrimidine/phosphomethylpyrimidine kinase
MSQDFMSKMLGIPASNTPPVIPPIALTIAGSDSGGGAGIQADLRTFAALKVHGTSVITLVTAQNTVGVSHIHLLPEASITAQLEAVCGDLAPAAAKTGALGSAPIIRLVADMFTQRPLNRLVVDPVMVSKHGDALLPDDAVDAMRAALLPLALVVTPNRFEAERLTGRSVSGLDSMKDAARRIFDMGSKNVLLKGSHLDRIVRDLLYDGTGFIEFGADRVDSSHVHGSGCVFAAAITARLAHGDPLPDAVHFAREFITGAITDAPRLGSGISPVNPMFRMWR